MDSIWQQHRTFILKILAGLGVCLVCWIVGSSLSGKSVDVTKKICNGLRTNIQNNAVPAAGEKDAYIEATEKLQARINFAAEKIGEIRQGEDLRRGIIEDLLGRFGDDSEATRDRFLSLSRQSPVACVINLAGKAREYLVTKAGSNSVLLVEDVGYDKLQMEPAQIDRYLITLRTIVKVAEIAIESKVREVKQIVINAPSGGKFAGEKVFVREYPITFQVRGSSVSLLTLISRLNDPADMVVLKRLGRVSRDRAERNPDMLVAELEITALRIDPEAEIRE